MLLVWKRKAVKADKIKYIYYSTNRQVQKFSIFYLFGKKSKMNLTF